MWVQWFVRGSAKRWVELVACNSKCLRSYVHYILYIETFTSFQKEWHPIEHAEDVG